MLNVGGKGGKKYRGKREGGISDHASYYVFAQTPDGSIEAYPLREWYNFQPSQRYKSLSAEQAEEEFARRRVNLSNLMDKARLKDNTEDSKEPEEKVKTMGIKKRPGLRIDDLDDVMMDSDDDSDSSDDERANGGRDSDSDDDSMKKRGKKAALKKKKKNNNKKAKKMDSDDEAFEESDDGDEEGREMDYIESSDDEESDLEEQANEDIMRSVAEEDGLRT